MKKITLIFVITLFCYSMISQLNPTAILGVCSSSDTLNNYKAIHISDVFQSGKYKSVTVYGCDWQNTKSIFDPDDVLTYNSNTFGFRAFDYKIVHHESGSSTVTNTDGYVFELRDTSNSDTDFILFGDSYLDSTHSISSTFRQMGSDSTTKDLSDFATEAYEIYSYFVALDTTTTYESGYTPSELSYSTYFDDGTNWLKLILDTDRANELVGFQYYSDNNSASYTKFIKPNN